MSKQNEHLGQVQRPRPRQAFLIKHTEPAELREDNKRKTTWKYAMKTIKQRQLKSMQWKDCN